MARTTSSRSTSSASSGKSKTSSRASGRKSTSSRGGVRSSIRGSHEQKVRAGRKGGLARARKAA